MSRKYIKKISSYSIVGGLGATLVLGLLGCQDGRVADEQTQSEGTANSIKKDGAFVIIEKDKDGYKIVEEYPSKETRVVLRENGVERILSKEEIDKIVKEENVKIDNGTSELTKPQSEVTSGSGGMGLGAALLSSMAGAAIGSYIGNKLFNNQNFQNQRNTRYQNPSAYSRSVDSFNKQTPPSTNRQTQNSAPKQSGFFGSQSKSGSGASGTSFGG